jgi:hypothetical protein
MHGASAGLRFGWAQHEVAAVTARLALRRPAAANRLELLLDRERARVEINVSQLQTE